MGSDAPRKCLLCQGGLQCAMGAPCPSRRASLSWPRGYLRFSIAASAAHLLWGQGEGGRLASEIRHREVERCHFATRNMLVNSKLP